MLNPCLRGRAPTAHWLRDRTMRSDKHTDEIETKVDAMKMEMLANQALIMWQLRSTVWPHKRTTHECMRVWVEHVHSMMNFS
jgi:hypothetical protein